MGHNVFNSCFIIKKVTGLNASEFIKIRLFKPMKIELPSCDTCASGLDQSGGGMYLNIEDMRLEDMQQRQVLEISALMLLRVRQQWLYG